MTRLEAIRHIRSGNMLTLGHLGETLTFDVCIVYSKLHKCTDVTFHNKRPWGGMYRISKVSGKQLLGYIKRNYV